MSKWIWICLTTLAMLALGARSAFATKDGVVLSSRMSGARRIMAHVWAQYGYTLTVTSGIEGTHGSDSLHASGLAEDYRIRDIRSVDLSSMVAAVRSQLGSDYDVVIESDHVHVEYDPS